MKKMIMKQEEKPFTETLPGKLRQLRLNRGWSQGQLAKKIDVNVQLISKYERGTICPPTKVMVDLANVFDVSLDYLLRSESERAAGKIKNPELLRCIEEIDDLSEKRQEHLVAVLDAFIKQQRFEELIAN